MSVGRLWLALVLALFCLPLFVGLGRGDVLDDEAIYSFAVDRMLETGDWLEPKSIPNEDWAFVEKPPLKFWIVALPMQLGLLPHDQFGLRFWDALFGAIAFGYVFLIGSRLLNPIAGVVAVLMLFVHGPLLFYHGLRSNNMEAALFLSYCGGIHHFMRWAGPGRPSSSAQADAQTGGSRHAVAVGLYFVLGFMTKFVAALFLPAVLVIATIAAPSWRRRVVGGWKTWLGVGCLASVLIAPWFVWAYLTYGSFLWEMMLGAHVVTRFTSYLDPAHVQPWYFYLSQIRFELAASGTLLFGTAGVLVLLGQTVYRRWPEGMLVLLWLAVPLAAISFGTSKLYHYMYPFLPPVALAGGYLVALALAVLPGPVVRRLRSQSLRLPAAFDAWRTRPMVRGVLLAIAGGSIAVAFVSLLFGPIRFDIPGVGSVRSSGVFRPILLAVVFGALGGAIRRVTHAVIVVLVVSLLPLPAYRRSLVRLNEGPTRLREARDCLLAVQQRVDGPGLHVDAPPPAISHPLYYYLRQVRPWTRAETPQPELLDRYLHDPASVRPILVWEPTYQAFWYGDASGPQSEPPSLRHPSPSMLVFEDIGSNTFLLLPGPYASCGAEADAR